MQDRPFHISSSNHFNVSTSYIAACHPEFQPLGRFPIESDEDSLAQFDQSSGISFSEPQLTSPTPKYNKLNSESNINISTPYESPLRPQYSVIDINEEPLLYTTHPNNDNYNNNDNPQPITFINRKESIFDKNIKIPKPQVIPKKYSTTATSPVKLFFEENKQKNYEIQQQQQQQQEKRLVRETINNISYNNINNSSEYSMSENNIISMKVNGEEDNNNLIESLLPIFNDFEIDYNTRMKKYNKMNISPTNVNDNEYKRKEQNKTMSPMTYIKYIIYYLYLFSKNENVLNPFVEDIFNEALYSMDEIYNNTNNPIESLRSYK